MRDVAYGLVAGALGAFIWAGVVYLTEYEIGWIAWGVGGLVGFAVAYGNDDKHRAPAAAGALAVGITVLSIVAGKYAAVQMVMPSDDEIVAMFTENVQVEEVIVSYVADEVAAEFSAAGRTVDWPAGVDPANAQSEGEYPVDVWAEAESRWAGWEAGQQTQFREDRAADVRANVEASLPEIRAAISGGSFADSFGGMDLIFFGLAMVTAWGMGSGKKSQEQVQSEYLNAIKLAMLRVMLADGSVEDDEVVATAAIFQQITGQEISQDEIRADAAVAQSGGSDLMATLTELGPHLNEDGRASVVKAAVMVALADGQFAKEEQHLVHGIARAIGMTDDDFSALLRELTTAQTTARTEEA